MPADFQSLIVTILLDAAVTAKRLAVYVLGGIFLGALAGTVIPKGYSFGFLKKGKCVWVLPLSAVLGIVSPVCTYGTVPVFIEAITRGASVGPAVAFLVSSSLVNPQMSVLAAGALGPKLALLQIAAAFAAAVIVGVSADIASARGIPIFGGQLAASLKGQDEQRESPNQHSHCKHSRHAKQSMFRQFIRRFIDLFEFVGFYFLLGAIIAAALPYVIDFGLLISLVGQGKWYAVPLAALASVPVYLCGGGMIPILSEASGSGMAKGAILAMLIAGPATRITSLTALAMLIRKRYVALYAAFIVLFAMALGYATAL